MKIIALSGGVASGKNFIANIFKKEFNSNIFDADKIVHKILKSNKEAFLQIKEKFQDCIQNDEINRKILGKIVFNDKKKLKILEEIIHPLVKKNYQDFLNKSKKNKLEFIILNIPLLLEKQGYDYDFLIAIIADFKIRKNRFIKRELKKNKQNKNQEIVKNLEEKFENIAKNQISDKKRIEKADFTINGNSTKNEITQILKDFIKKI